MSDVSICHYRLSRVEYDRAIEAGVFEADATLELIDGDLHRRTPEGSRHATGVNLAADCLRRGSIPGSTYGYSTRWRSTTTRVPEPDVAVVTGTIRDYRDGHPTSAVLIVEVSDESLHHDRTVKQRLYARCGIPSTGSSPSPMPVSRSTAIRLKTATAASPSITARDSDGLNRRAQLEATPAMPKAVRDRGRQVPDPGPSRDPTRACRPGSGDDRETSRLPAPVGRRVQAAVGNDERRFRVKEDSAHDHVSSTPASSLTLGDPIPWQRNPTVSLLTPGCALPIILV